MPNGLRERLRGARGVEILAALALVALLALMLLRAGGARTSDPGTALEARLERILSEIDGAGTVHAMIAEDGEGGVDGALIVAEGLTDVATYLDLQRAVTTLLKLDASQVEIIGSGGAFGGME